VSDQQPTQIGTPEERPEHRPPAPSPTEHNQAFTQPTAAEDYARGQAIRDGINSTSHGIR
jgi:hypothetical protein